MAVRRARTPVADVATVLRLQLRADLRQAAGNGLLSRVEQRTAMPHIQDAANELRAAGGAGARVTVDALEENLAAKALRLIDTVNQTSGAGVRTLSKAEAWSALRQGGRVGEAVLRAYEVASGNGLDVDELARGRVNRDIPVDAVFKTFATEAEATSFVEPSGKSVWWLVPGDEVVRVGSQRPVGRALRHRSADRRGHGHRRALTLRSVWHRSLHTCTPDRRAHHTPRSTPKRACERP